MNNHLNLNVLQDFIDINGGTFKLKVKWYNGQLYIEQAKESEGGIVHFTQMPPSATIETELKAEVLEKMLELAQVKINNTLEVTQEVTQPNKIALQNKFKQAMDFDLELYSNRPATMKVYTYVGLQRVEHDHTYVRALFTTNPYFATVFSGIRFIPYDRDIDALAEAVVQTVKIFAKDRLKISDNNDDILQFKVEKAFQITFYLNDEDVTKKLHQLLNKKKETRMTFDEFGFVAYIAYYQLFNGELNNRVQLEKI